VKLLHFILTHCDRNIFIESTEAMAYGFAGSAHYSGSLGHCFCEAILKRSVMADERPAQSPIPVLRTRPATMLTAIGLCLFIMVMQLVPEFSDGGRFSRITHTATTTAQ
jgi:hypothetical protein